MIFTSVTFFVFFILFFNVYWFLDSKSTPNIRNLFTLLASYLFYAWWDWRFLSLILCSSVVDYCVARELEKRKQPAVRKWLVFLSIAVNLSILGFFKYFNFFLDSFSSILDLFSLQINMSTLSIVLPVGISFYTFQTMSYTLDVYRGKTKACYNIITFFTFVAFFPQLVAGPIERAERMITQFEVKKSFAYNHAINGLRMVLWGFFYKLVIADNCGIIVDKIFENQQLLNGIDTWFGTFLFGIQIYADFAGYSMIAIGLARLLGIRLIRNFKSPYFSFSFREFWNRWHISLSQWFRDYLYIPLGGNRSTKSRWVINILITFILSGLWHGAAVTFLIWGTLHGIALILEKLVFSKYKGVLYSIAVIITVFLLWMPFRADSTEHLINMTQSILIISEYQFINILRILQDFSINKFILLIVIILCVGVVEKEMKEMDFAEFISSRSKAIRWTSYYVICLIILMMINLDAKPEFIYFQF